MTSDIPIWFDSALYVKTYGDLSGMNPVSAWEHFTNYGIREGRRVSIMPSNAPVQIFTMVKDEIDIVEDWVHYHASIVGIENIRVVDNMSSDGTYEALVASGAGVIRLPNYKLKGVYMTELCKLAPEYAIPLDIDEFLVDFDGKNIQCATVNSITSLPKHAVNKMIYIDALVTSDQGYERAVAEATNGSINDYGNFSKSFFYNPLFTGNIDHGNHYLTDDYYAAPLGIVHYHFRNPTQHRSKVISNVRGLGYKDTHLPMCGDGIHHVEMYRKMLRGEHTFSVRSLSETDVDLSPLRSKILTFPPPTLKSKPALCVRDPSKLLIVVARYNESLEWLNEAPFNNHQYLVYNKGINDNFVKTNVVQIIKLANVGRCDHTYLFHIVKNFTALPNVCVFFPGSIDLPHKRHIAIRILNSVTLSSATFIAIMAPIPLKDFFRGFKLDEYECVHPANFVLNNENVIYKSKLRPFGRWFRHHFGEITPAYYQHFGVFSIDKRDILQHPITRYINILAELAENSNPEVGHYCERAWGGIFFPLKTTKVEL